MSKRTGETTYRCCSCCDDVAKGDHVGHGGTVEKDGHEIPCLTCGDEDRIRLRLAQAWSEGYEAGHPEASCSLHPRRNPYGKEIA